MGSIAWSLPNLCAGNATLDSTLYSSPMPLIGLYISGASWVCLLFIFLDYLAAFCRKKPWLPCKFFSLNSVTLTLLSIATKIPVDLTTPMPSALDQLSKLTGTALICISMGLFRPSLGINTESESLTNMAALTIMVLTIVSNICIQMRTGVVFMFLLEHITILSCMLLLLANLWFSALFINIQKSSLVDTKNKLLLKGETCLLRRLILCYTHSYNSNPQFLLYKRGGKASADSMCVICQFILTQAVFRSLVLKQFKFCDGVSDYGWSMKIVVMTQLLIVLVGSLASGFRWSAMLSYGQKLDLHGMMEDVTGTDIWLFGGLSGYPFLYMIKILLSFFVFQSELFTMFLSFIMGFIRVFCCEIFPQRVRGSTSMDEFEDLIPEGKILGFSECEILKVMKDIKALMEKNRRYRPERLVQLFSRTPPSRQSLATQVYSGEGVTESVKKGPQNQANLDDALNIIKEFRGKLYLKHRENNRIVGDEVHKLTEFITRRVYESVEELQNHIEQLYVDMLNELLVQLPSAILKDITDSPVEEYEGRARRALKFMCNIESLDSYIRWSFPFESGITSFIKPRLPQANIDRQMQSNQVILHVGEDDDHNIPLPHTAERISVNSKAEPEI